MSRFMSVPAVLNSKAAGLIRCAKGLRAQKDVLESVLHDDFATGAAYDTVMGRLRGISERITIGQIMIHSQYSALMSIADIYARTENSILGAANGRDMLKGSIHKGLLWWQDDEDDDDGIRWFKEDALVNIMNELQSLRVISDNATKEFFQAFNDRDLVACIEAIDGYVKDLAEEGRLDALACIPRYLSNEGFIAFYEALRTGEAGGDVNLETVLKWYGNTIEYGECFGHYISNHVELSTVYKPGRFIENQQEWGNILYGKDSDYPIIEHITNTSNMAASGCEVIAVANALTNLGKKLDNDAMALLIMNFEQDGMVLNGVFGTSPMALYEYMLDKGYEASYITSTDPTEIKHFAQDYRTFIVTGYNDRNDISRMVHTVCITKNYNGTFTVHNSGSGPYTYPTFYEAVQSINYGSAGNCEPIMITRVR